jgi:hypothetical protein
MIKNIRDLYRGISDIKKGYQPRTNIVKDEKNGFVLTNTLIWLGGGNFPLSCSMYLGLVMLSRYTLHTYIQLDHYCLSRVL